MRQPLVFVSAGDISGDTAVARVIAALRKRHPKLACMGLGGPRLKQLGQRQLVPADKLDVIGFWEVIHRLPFFRKLLARAEEEIRTRRPACVLLVDYPGFNLRLAQRIKPLGIPVIYYITPQVWAWGHRRTEKIKRAVDRVLVILPFEEAFFRRNGVNSTFVGHYLLEDIPEAYLASPLPGHNRLALLPGSRRQEVARMLVPMLDAARRLYQEHGLTAVVAGLKGIYDYEAAMAAYADSGIDLVYDDTRRIIYESDYVLTASGTATLEVGLIGRPMVIVYKTGFVSYQIARRIVKLDAIGLVNLTLGRKVVPELIQHEFTPENMAAQISRYAQDDTYRRQTIADLQRLSQILGGVGASERVAAIIEEYL